MGRKKVGPIVTVPGLCKVGTSYAIEYDMWAGAHQRSGNECYKEHEQKTARRMSEHTARCATCKKAMGLGLDEKPARDYAVEREPNPYGFPYEYAAGERAE